MLPCCHPGISARSGHFETRDHGTGDPSHESETLDSLLALPFDGRVVPHDDDPLKRYSDFDGKPTVVYPRSDEGLCHAIKLKQHLGNRGFLRSGLSSSGDGPLQAEGGLVVDFSCFTRIAVGKTGRDGKITIEVEAG